MKIEITYTEAKQILSSLHETENILFGFTSSWMATPTPARLTTTT